MTHRVSFGRNQIYDVVVKADGQVVAYFTGQENRPAAPRPEPDPGRKAQSTLYFSASAVRSVNP